MNATDYVKNHYENYDEDGRLAKRDHLPEFLTTMRYVERYLTPGAKVLEIGAGTGRYTLALAGMGYDVTAVELVEHNLEILKSKIAPGMRVTPLQGNACDLSFLQNDSFDTVLLLGPMYHLFTEADKKKALTEALRVLKPGGVLFTAYCVNDFSMLHLFHNRRIFDILQKGQITEDFHATSVPEYVFELYRKEDIERLTADLPAERLHYVGTDMLSYLIGDSIETMTDAEFEEYLRFHFAVCERPDCVGWSAHVLDVLKKNFEC